MFRTSVVVALVYVLGIVGASCPKIISRKQWGAKEGNNMDSTVVARPATHVIIHHTSTPKCTNQLDCEVMVKSLQFVHMTYKGQDDIGYNFLIGEDGNVYEGVGWDKAVDILPLYDRRSIHIGLMGDYTSWLPGTEALNATKKLIECAVSKDSLYKDYRLVGHKQLDHSGSLDCPGTRLQQEIERWPNWSQY